MKIVAQKPPETQTELVIVVAEESFNEILEAMDEFECTCGPLDDLACRGCKAYSQAKSGDEIPF